MKLLTNQQQARLMIYAPDLVPNISWIAMAFIRSTTIFLFVIFAGPTYGQIRISDGSEVKDPIDIAFETCMSNWDGRMLSDWRACVSRADTDWDSSMNLTYRQLLTKLPYREGRLLTTAQKAWVSANAANRAFVESRDLKFMFGAEGEISYYQNLMLKSRFRTLELREYLDVFVIE